MSAPNVVYTNYATGTLSGTTILAYFDPTNTHVPSNGNLVILFINGFIDSPTYNGWTVAINGAKLGVAYKVWNSSTDTLGEAVCTCTSGGGNQIAYEVSGQG